MELQVVNLVCISGGNFSDGFAAGFAGELASRGINPHINTGNVVIDMASRATASAIVGGTASALMGGNFENGARTGAFGYLYNALNHIGAEKYQEYKDRDALKISMGPNAIRLGERPLFNGDSMYSSDDSHQQHIDAAHEQIFWTGPLKSDGSYDLYNSGYFSGTGIGEDAGFPGNTSKYEFGPVYHNVVVTDSALHPSGFQPKDYNLIKHNCQHYANAVFDQLHLNY